MSLVDSVNSAMQAAVSALQGGDFSTALSNALDARLKRLEAAAAATPLSADTDASGEADRQAEPPPIRTAAPPALRGRKLKRD